jgi:hypothetical protein
MSMGSIQPSVEMGLNPLWGGTYGSGNLLATEGANALDGSGRPAQDGGDAWCTY